MTTAALFRAALTPAGVVIEIAMAGGVLWIDSGSADDAIRHRGAPTNLIGLLRDMDRGLVVAAVEEHAEMKADGYVFPDNPSQCWK